MIVGVIALAVSLFVFRIVGRRGKSDPAAKAADAIENAVSKLRDDLQTRNKVMDRQRGELDSIRKIPNEIERLKRLAHFANERRRRG